MAALDEVNAYFACHPLSETYGAFTAAQRTAALAVARRDVFAAIGEVHDAPADDSGTDTLFAALAEQTLHLLLHPESLRISGSTASGGVVLASETIDGVGTRVYRELPEVNLLSLGPRAALYLRQYLTGRPAALHLVRG